MGEKNTKDEDKGVSEQIDTPQRKKNVEKWEVGGTESKKKRGVNFGGEVKG